MILSQTEKEAGLPKAVMATLHFTDMAALCRSVEIDGVRHFASAEEIEAAESAHLIDGMPFSLKSKHSRIIT